MSNPNQYRGRAIDLLAICASNPGETIYAANRYVFSGTSGFNAKKLALAAADYVIDQYPSDTFTNWTPEDFQEFYAECYAEAQCMIIEGWKPGSGRDTLWVL